MSLANNETFIQDSRFKNGLLQFRFMPLFSIRFVFVIFIIIHQHTMVLDHLWNIWKTYQPHTYFLFMPQT